jgi:hypothetical protein
MAGNSIIKCCSWNLVPENRHSSDASTVYTAPLCVVKSLSGESNVSLPRLPCYTHAEDTIPTFLTCDIYIALCLPKAATLIRLWSSQIFKVMMFIPSSNSVSLQGILNISLLKDGFSYRLVGGIHLKVGVPLPLQCKVRTPAPGLRWTILALQISLNGWLWLSLLHPNGQ